MVNKKRTLKTIRLATILALTITIIYIFLNHSLSFSKISNVNIMDGTLKSSSYIYFFDISKSKIPGKTIELSNEETRQLISIFDEYTYKRIYRLPFKNLSINDGYNIHITLFSDKAHYSIIMLDERGYVYVMEDDKLYRSDFFDNENGNKQLNMIMDYFKVNDVSDLE